ncbi:MAG: allantoate deiminase [Chthoniobacter sp.]|jgi:allantoate deiminase|nr:allantoate deiminase [Chthoniobacter sp.]
MINLNTLATSVMRRADELGGISDEPGRLTRTFHSAAMRRANALVGGWMRDAGLEEREDAAFNLIGRWSSVNPKAKTLLLGSHLDTVRDAGKYDGPLGVLTALAVVQQLKAEAVTLPFHVEVIGFSDEEGVRYQTSYLGSRALAGTLTKRDLALIEEKGIERAKRQRRELLAYAEVHIEQGPVLESAGLAVGVVTGIAGQSRVRVVFTGRAGHAGTTPMQLRHDALCAAAEFILAVERCGVTATVGQIDAQPGASNVIPGAATLSLDVRHPHDARRLAAVKSLHERAAMIAKKRRLRFAWSLVQQTASVACDPQLTAILRAAVAKHQARALALPSGAGHDAAAIAALCPVALLFVRCKGGISHHPAESVKTADVAKGIAVLREFVLLLAERHA